MGTHKFRQPVFNNNGSFSHWHYWGWISEGNFVSPMSMSHNVKDEKGQQYTGLKDKNGKEIYEGDIVSASIYTDETPQILEVEFQCGGFIIEYEDSETDISLLGWFPSSVEIIGNIYENPELLEDKI